jgi:serine/threonine protein kinase
MDETGIATIVAGIARGMKFIHSKRGMHRDLNPENILIHDNGYVRIAQFGNSYGGSLDATLRSGLGKENYRAPELWDDVVYTPAVDVFSFALILYELLIGEPAFSPTTRTLELRSLLRGPTRPDLPEDMHEVVKRIIQKNWLAEGSQRGNFDEIWDMLDGIDFKLTPGVDSEKVRQFVRWVEGEEAKA